MNDIYIYIFFLSFKYAILIVYNYDLYKKHVKINLTVLIYFKNLIKHTIIIVI